MVKIMKRFFSLLAGLAIVAASSSVQAQIDWAAGAPFGTSGGSIQLGADGIESFLPTGISAALIAPTSGADYTISAWINSSLAATDPTVAGANRWWFGTGDQGLHLGVQTQTDINGLDTNGLTSGHWSNDSTGATTVPVDQWVHATHVYRNGVHEIYFNGVLESLNSGGAVGAPNRDGSDLMIGSRRNGNNNSLGPGWIGFIDDLAMFTSALSAEDIAALANDSSQAVDLGAVAYYNFEDPQTGTTAANLVSVTASGLTGTDGSPALQELDGIGVAPPEPPPVATWTAGAPMGTTGGALSFSGNGSLDSGIAASLVGGNRGSMDAPTLGSDYTVAAWINSAEDDGMGTALSNRWWFGTGNQGLHFGILDGNLRHGHWSSDNSGVTLVPANTWVHATFAFDADGGSLGTGEVTIYLDGTEEGTFDTVAPNVSGTDLIIGSRSGAGGPAWVGAIDDLAIFTSTLSAADVATLAADASEALSLGAAAYYNFEDPQTGTTAANLVDVADSGLTSTDGSPALQELDGIVPSMTALKGDVNLDGGVTFFDIQPFIDVLANQGFQAEADCNCDGMVNFFDIQPFIDILAGSN